MLVRQLRDQDIPDDEAERITWRNAAELFRHQLPRLAARDRDTIAGVVARNARATPDGVAFVEAASGETMTWREYDERSSRDGRRRSRAFAPGDRVALQLPDGPGVHAAMLACEKAGLVAVGIGARAGEREVEHLVERSGARTLLTANRRAASTAATNGRSAPTTSGSSTPRRARPGCPKIVMHTQARWFAFHEFADRVAHFTADDVFLSALPAPFGFGLWTAHFSPAIVGRAVRRVRALRRRGRAARRSSATASRCSPRCRRSS